MSHFVQVSLELSNPDLLIQALKNMGYAVVRGLRAIQNDYGSREQVDISIVGKPIGFKKSPKGYAMVADFWGLGIDRQQFVRNLKREYAKLEVSETCKKAGLVEGPWTQLEDGTLEMVAVRRRW